MISSKATHGAEKVLFPHVARGMVIVCGSGNDIHDIHFAVLKLYHLADSHPKAIASPASWQPLPMLMLMILGEVYVCVCERERWSFVDINHTLILPKPQLHRLVIYTHVVERFRSHFARNYKPI